MVTLRSLAGELPEGRKNDILERMFGPGRVIVFRVPREDVKGSVHVNRGYRG